MVERNNHREHARIEEARIVERVTRNLILAQGYMQETPTLAHHLESTGESITLVARTRLEIVSPPPITLYPMWPVPVFHRSRISLSATGVTIKHDLRNTQTLEAGLTPGLAAELWEQGEARSLLKGFAKLKPDQIQRELVRSLK